MAEVAISRLGSRAITNVTERRPQAASADAAGDGKATTSILESRKTLEVSAPSKSEATSRENTIAPSDDGETVKRMAKQLNEFLARSNVDLRIEKGESGKFVYELVDRKTGETVRRIPPDVLRTKLDEITANPVKNRAVAGVLVDKTS